MSDSKNQIQSASFVVPVLELRGPDPADVYTFLKNKAESAPNLFSGAPIIVDISELSDLPDLLRIKDAVGRTGFLLVGFTGIKNEADRAQFATLNIPVLSASAGSASRPQQPQIVERVKEVIKEVRVPVEKPVPVPAAKTRIFRGKIHSGQKIYAEGSDLIVIGDVGNGAEVLADGSIHVYGRLLGKAFAGIKNNDSAMIFCDSFDPELVSINGIYILSDRITDSQRMKRVAVSLNNNRIEVQSL